LTGGLGQTSIPDTVFVHGYGGAPDHWDAVRRELPPELRGSAVTLPGHAGRASELAEFSIEAAAHDIAQQVPERPVVLVGHSMGARIAMEIAVRSQAQVAALILIDGSCVPADPTVASDMIARALSSRGKAALAEELIEDALPGRLPSEARKALTIAMAKMADDAMIQYTGSMAAWDSTRFVARVSSISCPGLILQSTRYGGPENPGRHMIEGDPASLWVDVWKRIAQARFRFFYDTGHYLAQERPRAVAQAIRSFVVGLGSGLVRRISVETSRTAS